MGSILILLHVIMTIKQILGNNKYWTVALLFFLLSSCSPKYINDTKQHNHTVVNEQLKIKLGLAGDIQKIKNFNSVIKILKKNFSGVKRKDIIYVGETNIEPYYYIYLFSGKCNLKVNDSDNVTYSIRSKKINGNDYFILLLAMKKMRTDLENDATNSIEKLIDINENPYGLIDFFNDYKHEYNVLYFKDKLANSNIKHDVEKSFNDLQYLITYYSILPDYEEYKTLNNFYKPKRKQIPDSLLNKGNINEENVLDILINISESKNIVMLNENHWFPEDRILALKFLRTLKQNGFNILAVEALNHDKEANLNERKYPLTTDGYYFRDPFFGILIREALNSGFKIVAYDYYDEANKREEIQAKNLYNILIENSDNKLFVYAGFEHIFEKNSSKIWMAELFKKQSGIDPLTIDQNRFFSNKVDNFQLFQSNILDTLNRVDYYVNNNLQPTLENVFDHLSSFSYKNIILKDYKGQELFYSIYYSEEYETYKTKCIPLLNNVVIISDDRISFKLPKGSFTLRIENRNKNVILIDSFDVK